MSASDSTVTQTSLRFLLTNDDGIHAPGLAALERVVSSFGPCYVLAPSEHHSGCSHRVSTHEPIDVVPLEKTRFAVHGTPADCTRVGLVHLAPDVQCVVAGINDGGNLGVDVHMSGTVAAVREAALFGKAGIAFSQYRPADTEADWEQAARMVRRVLALLLQKPHEPGTFWNVNLPFRNGRDEEPEIVFCPLEPAHLPVQFERNGHRFHYRAAYHERPRRPGSDVDVCFSGHIAVTRMNVGLGG